VLPVYSLSEPEGKAIALTACSFNKTKTHPINPNNRNTHTSKHVIKYQNFTKRTLTQAQLTLNLIYAATQPPFKTQLEL